MVAGGQRLHVVKNIWMHAYEQEPDLSKLCQLRYCQARSARLFVRRLDLETLRLDDQYDEPHHKASTYLSSSTGPFELPPFALHIRPPALQRSTEMLDCLPHIPLAPQQHGVTPCRGAKGELVERQAFSAGGGDSLARGCGESQCGNGDFGQLGESFVIENRTDEDDGLGVVGIGLRSLLDNTREGDGRTVDLRVNEALPVSTRLRKEMRGQTRGADSPCS